MAIIQKDVKLVYGGDGGDGNIIATPQGSSLNGIIRSGFPNLQGVDTNVDSFRSFDDGPSLATLGVEQGGSPVGTWPYRKHDWQPTGGIDGLGAINMHWFTGMSIGFSPVRLTPIPISRYFMVEYDVKQTALMQIGLNGVSGGSNRKLHRFYTLPLSLMGTLLSNGNTGRIQWYWETWTSNDPVSPQNLGVSTPADGLWHKYRIVLDFRETLNVPVVPNPGSVEQNYMSFYLDDIFIRTVNEGSRVGDKFQGSDLMTPQTDWTFSPICEMYSCGNSGACSAGINTGDYTVDNFAYTDLS